MNFPSNENPKWNKTLHGRSTFRSIFFHAKIHTDALKNFMGNPHPPLAFSKWDQAISKGFHSWQSYMNDRVQGNILLTFSHLKKIC
jgi:hypothetical protein